MGNSFSSQSAELIGGIAEREYGVIIMFTTQGLAQYSMNYFKRKISRIDSKFNEISSHHLCFPEPCKENCCLILDINNLSLDALLKHESYLIHLHSFLVCNKIIYYSPENISYFPNEFAIIDCHIERKKGKECCFIFHKNGVIRRIFNSEEEAANIKLGHDGIFNVCKSVKNKNHILYYRRENTNQPHNWIRDVKKLNFIYDKAKEEWVKADNYFIIVQHRNVIIFEIAETIKIYRDMETASATNVFVMNDNSIIVIDEVVARIRLGHNPEVQIYVLTQGEITNQFTINGKCMDVTSNAHRLVMALDDHSILVIDDVHSKNVRKIKIDEGVNWTSFTTCDFVPNTSILIVYNVGEHKDDFTTREHNLLYAYDIALNKRLCKKEIENVASFIIVPSKDGTRKIYEILVEFFRNGTPHVIPELCRVISDYI